MAPKSNMLSILQFDGHLIAWLRVAPSAAGLDVVAYEMERGTWSAEDASLGSALKAFAATRPIAEDTLCTVVPRHEATARILDLPTEDPAEAANMIRFSAEDFVPYAADELTIDQAFLEQRPNGETRTIAVLVHNDMLDAHLRLLAEAGLSPERIFLSTACLAAGAAAAGLGGGEEDAAETGEGGAAKRMAVVNLGAGGLEVAVLDRGRLQFSRAVATAQDWGLIGGEAGAESLDELAVEVRGSLSAYMRETEDGIGVDEIHLCSEWAEISGVPEALRIETGKTCSVAECARGVVVAGTEHLAASPLVMLGAALMAQDRAPFTIDLLPESMAEKYRLASLRRLSFYGAGLAAVILLSIAALYYQALHQRRAYITELRDEVARLAPQAQGVAAMRQQLEILRGQVDRQGSVLELLASTTETAPKQVLNMTRFSYHHESGVDLWGRAKKVDDVFGFAEGLRNLANGSFAFWARAESMYEEEARERNKEVQLYQISVPFFEEDDADEFSAKLD